MRLDSTRRKYLSDLAMADVLSNESVEGVRQFMEDYVSRCTDWPTAKLLAPGAEHACRLALDLRCIDPLMALRSRLSNVPFRSQPLANQVAAQYIRFWDHAIHLGWMGGGAYYWKLIPLPVVKAAIEVLCTGLRPLGYEKVIWAGLQYLESEALPTELDEYKVLEAAVLHNCFSYDLIRKYYTAGTDAHPMIYSLVRAKWHQIATTSPDEEDPKTDIFGGNHKPDADELTYLRLCAMELEARSERNLEKAVYG